MEPKILVCGFGNKIRKDDGLGPRIVEQLAAETLPDNVTLRDFGTSGFRAALEMGDYDKVIVVDATRTGREPGTVYRLALNRDDVVNGLSLSSFSISLHENELERVLATAALIDGYPGEVVILGCEPGDISLGLTQSDQVSEAAAGIIDMIFDEIAACGDSQARARGGEHGHRCAA